nr:acyl--CoA ligase [candidate division Zixibacteria bacterium]
MKVHDLLKIGARNFLENRAVVHGDRAIKYRQLLASVEKVAEYLGRLPFDKDTRIALLYENSIEYAILFFAIFRAGFVAVPLDTSLRAEKLNFIINDCQARMLMIQTKFRRHLDIVIGKNSPLEFILSNKNLNFSHERIRTTVLSDLLGGVPEEIEIVQPESDDSEMALDIDRLMGLGDQMSPELAAIFYTSGSTGASKGVMLSHRNLVSNTVATVKYLELTGRDAVLVILPFYYIYGNSLLLTHVLVGGTLVVDNRFLYPEVVLDTMEKEAVTGFSGVPSNFIILLNKSTLAERKFPNLRYFTQAGGSMAPEIIKKLMSSFPDKQIYIMYGQTEAAPRASYLPPEKLAEKLGSIGIPVPGVTLKVVDDNGRELPDGESGELLIYGNNVMLGYWNQPAETAETIRDGWLYTGDLARRDEDGFFFITGRKKEIIKTGGNRVSAKEVEECILELDKVHEAAVIGIRDDLLGEAIKAVIVLREGMTADKKEIQYHCRTRLSEHKIPKYIEFMEVMPKYQSGKINKPLLKEMSNT